MTTLQKLVKFKRGGAVISDGLNIDVVVVIDTDDTD
jgi:hypothetical protein